MSWQSYLSEPHEKLLVRFTELCEEIAGREEELGMILSEEKRNRARGFHDSESTSVSGQERDATLAATEDSAEFFKRKGELLALREEKEVLIRLLDEGTDARPEA